MAGHLGDARLIKSVNLGGFFMLEFLVEWIGAMGRSTVLLFVILGTVLPAVFATHIVKMITGENRKANNLLEWSIIAVMVFLYFWFFLWLFVDVLGWY